MVERLCFLLPVLRERNQVFLGTVEKLLFELSFYHEDLKQGVEKDGSRYLIFHHNAIVETSWKMKALLSIRFPKKTNCLQLYLLCLLLLSLSRLSYTNFNLKGLIFAYVAVTQNLKTFHFVSSDFEQTLEFFHFYNMENYVNPDVEQGLMSKDMQTFLRKHWKQLQNKLSSSTQRKKLWSSLKIVGGLLLKQ